MIQITDLIRDYKVGPGGYTYDPDYNRLKKIVSYCCNEDWDPIEDLVESIHDPVLKSKVRAWMAQEPELVEVA